MKKHLLIFCLALASFVGKAQIIYVNYAASGANDGSSWANAYTNLQTALTATSAGQIWVAQGDYKPGTSGQNTATFLLKNGVEIYGGFAGGETVLSQRNPAVNGTVLSGDLDNNFSWGANDAYHVVTATNVNNTAIIDGFTIARGNAVGTSYDAYGGGVLIKPTVAGVFNPQIINCYINNNIATTAGSSVAAVSVTGTQDVAPSFLRCYINDNFLGTPIGGGAYFYAAGAGSKVSPRLENCFFNNNLANFGNHIAFDCTVDAEVHANVTGCTFYGNNTGSEVYYNTNGSVGAVELYNNILYQMDLATDGIFIGNNNCTASPLVSGVNNSSFNPAFVNPGAGNYRLMCGSPAINAGDNTYANTLVNDIEGNPRISGSSVDMGCYERILPNVSATAFPGNILCQNDMCTLSGSGAVSYSWNNGVTDNASFAATTSGNYIVTGAAADGCVNTFTINLTVNPLPTVGFTASSTGVCVGTSVVLSGTGAFTYNWDNGVVDGASFTPSVGTLYTVTGTDVNSCVNTAQVYVDVETSTVTIAGTDINLCSGVQSVNLSAASYGGSLMWSTAGTGGFSNPFIASTVYYPSAGDDISGLVKITLSSVYNYCPTETDTINVYIHPVPSINLGADYTICETDSILLQAGVTGGTPPFTYNWGNGGTISTTNNEYYTPLVTSTINLHIIDNYGCVANDTVLVTVDASETLTINMNVGAGVLTDGTLYVLRFAPQQAAFDTMFAYPFSAGTGTIIFNSFPYGNYLLKIAPDTNLYPTLIPTYYGDGNDFQWDSATVINHNCNNPFVANINMIPLLGGTGNGTVSGFVLEGVGFGARLGNGFNHVMVPGGPLKGIDVKLGKNPGGGIQARTMSDSTGYYHFDSIPSDSYRIYVDIPGLPMDSFYVVNVQADSSINLNYFADSNSVYPILPTAVGFVEYANTNVSTFEMYPNPASSKTSLVFSCDKQNQATIKVLDITGKQVMNIALTNLPKGKHEYQLNFDKQQLQSGIYFIELINESGKQVKKLIVE